MPVTLLLSKIRSTLRLSSNWLNSNNMIDHFVGDPKQVYDLNVLPHLKPCVSDLDWLRIRKGGDQEFNRKVIKILWVFWVGVFLHRKTSPFPFSLHPT
jgi:hypothetical protein